MLAAASSALLVACLVKPSPPGRTTGGDGGTNGDDAAPRPGDGSSEGGDASTGPGATCQTHPAIDPFDGMSALPCPPGPTAAAGVMKMSAGGVSELRCTWTPATIGHGVLVDIQGVTASGTAGYAATAKLRLTFGGVTSTMTALQVGNYAGATNYSVSTTTSITYQAPFGSDVWLLLQITSDSTLVAKYRTGTFDADLSTWTAVSDAAFGAGTTTQPPTVDLVIDSGGTGSGSGSASFASFDYCP